MELHHQLLSTIFALIFRNDMVEKISTGVLGFFGKAADLTMKAGSAIQNQYDTKVAVSPCIIIF
jgi:hypothetical protein